MAIVRTRMSLPNTITWAVAVAGLFTLTALGPMSSPVRAALGPPPSSMVAVQNFRYVPGDDDAPATPAVITQGTALVFSDPDIEGHSLTADAFKPGTHAALFDSGIIYAGQQHDVVGASALSPGIYHFHCIFHPIFMQGTLQVVALGSPVPPPSQQKPPVPPTRHPGVGTASCDLPPGQPAPGSGIVRRVPGKYRTVQAAVDAASEGDTILISPGTYREAVTVNKPGLRIRGTDRNKVVLDGEGWRPNGLYIAADRVVVENLSTHRYARHGVWWVGVTGYWGRYLTAYDNFFGGVRASDSRCGQWDHVYASGNQYGFGTTSCFKCDAVITQVTAEHNAGGYGNVDAGGNLTVEDSLFDNNASGLTLVSNNGTDEECWRAPDFCGGVAGQLGAVIKNNVIRDNNYLEAPYQVVPTWGFGIGISGGMNNLVENNQILGHARFGVALILFPGYLPQGNQVRGNTVSHDPGSQLDAIDLAQGSSVGANNCWSGNKFTTSAPAVGLQVIWGCPADSSAQPSTPQGGDPRVEAILGREIAAHDELRPSTQQPSPASQPQEPDDNGNHTYADDGALDSWLPALPR